MQAEKKKLLILGILAVALLSVGAFTLTGGSKSTPAPATAAKPLSHSHVTASEPAIQPGIATPGGAPAVATAPAATQQGGKPFGKPLTDTRPGSPDASQPSGTAVAPIAEQEIPERDPFDGRKFIPDDKKPAAPVAAPTPPPVRTASTKPSKIAPMPVTMSGGLPTANTGGAPLAPLNEKKDDFDYTVTGVITGDRPAAVFVDSKGDQRLITLGGSIDGDTKVISIARGKVIVEFHGKKRTLSVEADTPTEKR